MIIEELVTITSLTNQVGTKIGQILAPQRAAVVNIYRSGLVSGATPYPAPLQILTLCGIMLFLVLEQMEYFLLTSSSNVVSFIGLCLRNCRL